MYCITYEQGNGYNCICCRRTLEEKYHCESLLEVIEWLSELEACKRCPRLTASYEDKNDRTVIEIKDISYDKICSFTFNENRVKEIIKKRVFNLARDTMKPRRSKHFRIPKTIRTRAKLKLP